jgi:hypothetical protein
MKINTNILYDTYILLHQKPRTVYSKKNNNVFDQGLDYDKGAIYLKSSIHRYYMNRPIYNGTPTQFEYLANKFWVEHRIKDLTQPWKVQYQTAIITGLMYKAIHATNRILKMYAESDLVSEKDTFIAENWLDTYTDGEREWIKPKKIESGFKFYKIREPEDAKYKMAETQPQSYIEFTKRTYSTLEEDWPLKHLEKKYGSLENAKNECKKKHPEIFKFAEKLKGKNTLIEE